MPLFHSLLWIVGSAVLINLTAYGFIKTVQYWKKRDKGDLSTPIVAIIQTGPEKEALPTNYLAELLELCIDQPTQTKSLDLKWAQQKLLSSPLIKDAEVKIAQPGILYVDYTIRHPTARIVDFEGLGMDAEGHLFPLNPFFTPKNIPEIYLGLEEEPAWNVPIKDERVNIALNLLDTLSSPLFDHLVHLSRIDVSNAFAKSLGRQEVVVFVEDRFSKEIKGTNYSMIFPHVLRLPVKKWTHELNNYLQLHAQLLEKEKAMDIPMQKGQTTYVGVAKVIDLLLPQLAFVDEQNLEILQGN